MSRSRPAFVIAGAHKSCSTSLAETLRMHPEIEMPRREVSGFDERNWEARHKRIVRRAARASELGLVYGFKRPEIFHEPEVAERVAKAMPGGRAVVVLRDPAERMFSAYFHYVDYGVLRIKGDPDRHLYSILTASSEGLSPIERAILRYSTYANSAKLLKRAFDDRVFILFQDELLHDPGRNLEAIQDFIGVSIDSSLHLLSRNVGRYPQRSNPAGRLFGMATFRIDSRDGHVTPRRPILRAVGRPLAQFRPRLPTTSTRPVLSERLRAVAQIRFGPDMALLEIELGRAVPPTWTVNAKPYVELPPEV